MSHVPAELRGVMDALLLGLDPRLTETERDDAMLVAVADAPEFVVGVLASIVEGTHRRIERLRSLPPGTFVDRMRAEYLGAPEVQEWGDGRWHDVDDPPEQQRIERFLASPDRVRERIEQIRRAPDPPVAKYGHNLPDNRRGTGPHGEWTVADAAAAAEQARLARQAADLGLATPGEGGRDQTGGQGLSEPLRPPSVDMPRQGVSPKPDPRVAEHLARLAQQRREEAAINAADPDRPETMTAAMTAAIDPSQMADAALGIPDGGNDTESPPLLPDGAGDPGGAGPQLCGKPTATGPCVLMAGHPVLPVPGTEHGHMSNRKA